MKLINEEARKLKQKESSNTNKILFVLMGIIVLTIIVVLVLLGLVQKQREIEENSGLLIDGEKSNLGVEDIFVQDGTVYYPIRDIAEALGYKTYKGEAKYQTEDADRCYIINANESVSFFEAQDYIYKLDATKSLEAQNYKSFQIDKPVITNASGELCISENGLMRACNVYITHELNSNGDIQTINITTLKTYISEYAKIASNQGLGIAVSQNFENQKALLYGWAVVADSASKYGIIDANGNELLGTKYTKIEYDEYTNVFKITDSLGKVGIWEIQKGTVSQKINNLYDSISLLDKEKELYCVYLNGKYGVVDFNGQVKVNIEYDGIGVDTTKYSVENPYLLYDGLIPVQKNNVWSILNLDGNEVATGYSSIGCAENKPAGAENALLVPEYGLVVVAKNNLYGLVNEKGQGIDCLLTSVYYSSSSGTNIAYMVADGTTYEVVKWLDEFGNGTVERYVESDDIFSDF